MAEVTETTQATTETAAEATDTVDTGAATAAAATETAESATTAAESATIAPVRKLAGKFEKAEELEADYLRKEGALEALRGVTASPKADSTTAPTDPNAQYSESDLEYLREQNFLAASNADLPLADKQKAMRQISLIDKELRTRAVKSAQTAEKSSAAQRNLATKAQTALKQFQSRLVAGDPLNDTAVEIYNDLVAAGYPSNDITRGMAVLSAAPILGINTNGEAVAKDRAALVKNMNKALKETVATGAGAATTSAAPVTNWMTADKAAYQRKLREVQGLD